MIKELPSNVEDLPRLRYRRQFVAAPRALACFGGWQHRSLADCNLHIYIHPDLAVTPVVVSGDGLTRMVLIGFAIDPNAPARGNEQIARDLLATGACSIDTIATRMSRLAGRFVLIVSRSGRPYVFHDPCGLRSVYYAYRNNEVFLGSQPSVFSALFPLTASSEGDLLHDSHYKASRKEYWVPSGVSLYEGVHHLVPNHYLDVTTGKQCRFWPVNTLPELPINAAVEEAADCLRSVMQSAACRFKLALPLTAGWDSRTILAAAKDAAPEIWIYTLLYRGLTANSPDVKIPHKILRDARIPHHIVDCTRPMCRDFQRVYMANASLAHSDWCGIAYGMLANYPEDRVCVKGNCSEIARCFYYKRGAHQEIKSGLALANYERGWASIPFIVDRLDEWAASVRELCASARLDILDLFYWEHRMGSWQAQSQLEWDIVQEAFTPFNCRPLLSAMLAVPSEYRRYDTYIIHRRVIERLWPQLLNWPINPPAGWREVLKTFIGSGLARLGVEDLVKHSLNCLRH